MTSQRLRIVLALIVVVVIGGTAIGIGPGGGSDAPTAAKPTADKKAVVAERVAALGPVATRGKAVFDGESGCGGCHTLAADGSSGKIGPDLDAAIATQDLATIKQDIVDPNAMIAEGYSKGLMPDDFGKKLTPEQVDDLAKWLSAVTAAP